MVGRQGGLSGKQKAALLKGKRAQVAAKKDLSEHPPERSARTDDSGRAFVQQVSKKGSVNNLSTRFMREDDAVVAERRTQAQKPFATQYETALVCSPDGSLGLPMRPAQQEVNAAAQEEAERVAFEEWATNVHARFPLDRLSPFEHNIEVWRQLWRCLERSDVVIIVADVRNPLLHVPQALYTHCDGLRSVRLVVVLSKVDLVSQEHVSAWHRHLATNYPAATVADFSAKGRPVGGSMGGGVASRRKAINSPLSGAEKRGVRAYVEGVAQACGVEFPEVEDTQVVAVGTEEEDFDEMSVAEPRRAVGRRGKRGKRRGQGWAGVDWTDDWTSETDEKPADAMVDQGIELGDDGDGDVSSGGMGSNDGNGDSNSDGDKDSDSDGNDDNDSADALLRMVVARQQGISRTQQGNGGEGSVASVGREIMEIMEDEDVDDEDSNGPEAAALEAAIEAAVAAADANAGGPAPAEVASTTTPRHPRP